MTIQRCFPVTYLANHAAKSMYMYECPDLDIVICGAELSDLITTSAYIPHAAYDCTERQKRRKCELHACLIGRVPRNSSPAGMQNPKFGLSWVHCVIQISQLLLSCVHCVIQNAHFELKFKIRNLPLCENSLSGEIDGFWWQASNTVHSCYNKPFGTSTLILLYKGTL